LEIDQTSLVGQWLQIGTKSLNGYERNQLYRNEGIDKEKGIPMFSEVGYLANADRIEDCRAAVVVDIDRDGDQDVLLQNFLGNTVVLVNKGPTGNWLQVKLQGTESNRDAIGTRVEIAVGSSRQVREVATTNGYLAGQSLECHFGLGEADVIDEVKVLWPSGSETRLENVRANQRLEIVEGTAESVVDIQR